MSKRTLAERFFEKFDLNGPIPSHRPELGPCHVFTGSRNEHGYGKMTVNRRQVRATHVAFFLAHGRWPSPCALHACDNGPGGCARAEHLFEGTKKDNSRDMVAKGRGNTESLPEAARKAWAKRRAQTHCKNGHELVGANLAPSTSGRRVCRVRRNENARLKSERRRRAAGAGAAFAKRTHCPAAHAYTPENTYVSKKGHRLCRACQKAHRDKRNAARISAGLTTSGAPRIRRKRTSYVHDDR